MTPQTKSKEAEDRPKLSKDDREKLKIINSRLVKAGLQICILKMLTEGPSHGYEIMKRARKLTKQISTSLIYNCLAELEKAGYVMGTWKHAKSTPSKKTYEITERGEIMLDSSKNILRKIMGEFMGSKH